MNTKRTLAILALAGAVLVWALLPSERPHLVRSDDAEVEASLPEEQTVEPRTRVGAAEGEEGHLAEGSAAGAGAPNPSERDQYVSSEDPRERGFVTSQDGKIILDGDRPPPGAPVTGPPGTEATALLPYD